MSIVVTGSIAFDYLMSFPGKFTEHFLPEHMSRVSLSFLVDTMDKRRGGCAPNIAYTLALLGETPRLMATAGQDFDDYRRWLEAAGVDTSLVAAGAGQVHGLVLLQHRRRGNQIASFYTGAMANAAELSFRTVADCRAGHRVAQRSGGDDPVRRGMPHARHPLHLGPGSAVRAHVRRGAAPGHRGRGPRDVQRLRARADSPEDRLRRGRDPRPCGRAGRDQGGEGLHHHPGRRSRSTSPR